VAYTQVFAENTVGKGDPLPSHLQRSVREVVEFNVLAS
jgi:hypothetical protein